MKWNALILVVSSLVGCVAANKRHTSSVQAVDGDVTPLVAYDETAEEFMNIFSVKADADGVQTLKTSDAALEVICMRGVRSSCSFIGKADGGSITVNESAADEFTNALKVNRDNNGNRDFKTTDGKLSINCAEGLQSSCTVRLQETQAATRKFSCPAGAKSLFYCEGTTRAPNNPSVMRKSYVLLCEQSSKALALGQLTPGMHQQTPLFFPAKKIQSDSKQSTYESRNQENRVNGLLVIRGASGSKILAKFTDGPKFDATLSVEMECLPD